MKNFLALLLALGLGAMIIITLNQTDEFPKYGEAVLSERVFTKIHRP